MGTEMALIEQIPLPDIERPARMPSLPEWLQHRSDALVSADKGNFLPVAKLPASLILSLPERAVVEVYVSAIARFLDVGQAIVLRERILTNDQAHGAMIAGLLTRKGARLDQAISEQITEDYLDAIEDIPAWCVREALRKWNRGESQPLDKKLHDFNWRPEPPILARLARLERNVIKHRVSVLRRLLAAEPEPEYSEEHRARMLAGVSGALDQVAASRRLPAADRPEPEPSGDGNHLARVAADLRARRERNAVAGEEGG